MRTRLRRITIGSYIFMAYITLLWSLIVIFALCYSDLAQGEDLLSGADWCFGLMPVVLWAAIIFAFLRIRTFTFDEAGFTVSVAFCPKADRGRRDRLYRGFCKILWERAFVCLSGHPYKFSRAKAGKYYELRELDYLHFGEILKVKILKIDYAKCLRLKREYIRENSPSIFDLIFWIGLFLFGDYLVGWMICQLFTRHYEELPAVPLISFVFVCEWLYIEFLLRMRREKERLKIRS